MCFPIFFPHYGNSILLEIVWINASHKICKKPIAYLYNVCVFLYLSLIMRIHLSYVFGIVCISASRKVCKKHLTFWHLNVLFFYTFPVLSEITISMFWGKYYWCEDLQKIFISDPISTQTFMRNSSLRKLTYIVSGPNPVPAFQIPLP